MKISEMIRQALEKKGFRNLKDASKVLGISPELLRVTINKGHIPKDKTLIMIANKLNLDKSVLILAAHQEKVPAEVRLFSFSFPMKFRRGSENFALRRTDQFPRRSRALTRSLCSESSARFRRGPTQIAVWTICLRPKGHDLLEIVDGWRVRRSSRFAIRRIPIQ
jgi:hypothetical protein